MLIDHDQVKPVPPDFVCNRVAMQNRGKEDIREKFDGQLRAIVPLFETEVRGVETLQRTAKHLFT